MPLNLLYHLLRKHVEDNLWMGISGIRRTAHLITLRLFILLEGLTVIQDSQAVITECNSPKHDYSMPRRSHYSEAAGDHQLPHLMACSQWPSSHNIPAYEGNAYSGGYGWHNGAGEFNSTDNMPHTTLCPHRVIIDETDTKSIAGTIGAHWDNVARMYPETASCTFVEQHHKGSQE